jgi:hypothetical protein
MSNRPPRAPGASQARYDLFSFALGSLSLSLFIAFEYFALPSYVVVICLDTGQAIRVMDLTTLDPIAPDPYVANCAPKGCYWTLTCTPAGTGTGNTGVRLRVAPINSDAGWSGMFFDK